MRHLIYNADITGNGFGWILTENDRIKAMAYGEGRPKEIDPSEDLDEYDAQGQLLMPGVIDCHVHFREPGLTHKASIRSESRAALKGGVTSYMEMPNTVPQTVTVEAWNHKMRRAAEDSAANYAFFIGATSNNLPELLEADWSRIPGIKLFLGSSTGNMLLNEESALDRLFSSATVPIVVHAEDEDTIAQNKERIIAEYGENPPVFTHSMIRPAEACVKATEKAIRLAKKHNARLHVAHLSTAEEIDMVRKARPGVTCEVSPHHLTFSTDDYEALGARIKMNPAIKSPSDREALRAAVSSGIDIIATDHAPHLLSEKEGGALTAVSGAPLVQFSLPLMLESYRPSLVARLMSEKPAELFGITDRGRLEPGCYADFVLLRHEMWTVTDSSVYEECKARWTPLAGMTLNNRVNRVYINGRLAVDGGSLVSPETSFGMPLEFNR